MDAEKSFLLAPIIGKARGLIAQRHISKGELITRDPCVEVSDEDWVLIDRTRLREYTYFRQYEARLQRFVSFGMSAFVNHSYNPNLEKYFEEDYISLDSAESNS